VYVDVYLPHLVGYLRGPTSPDNSEAKGRFSSPTTWLTGELE